MQPNDYMPHIDLILHTLRINRDRLNSKSKIAIDAKFLRILLQIIVQRLPFSSEFYTSNYPDVAEAFAAGKIPDLHRHYVESGFFEGRFGTPPSVDEKYYSESYKDVAQAISAGDVKSGFEHYMRSGASEGRIPNAEIRPQIEMWMSLLRDEASRAAG